MPDSTVYNKPAYEAMRGDKRSANQTVLRPDFTLFLLNVSSIPPSLSAYSKNFLESTYRANSSPMDKAELAPQLQGSTDWINQKALYRFQLRLKIAQRKRFSTTEPTG